MISFSVQTGMGQVLLSVGIEEVTVPAWLGDIRRQETQTFEGVSVQKTELNREIILL